MSGLGGRFDRRPGRGRGRQFGFERGQPQAKRFVFFARFGGHILDRVKFFAADIQLNDIPIVPLYFADLRPTVMRDGMLLMVDDDRFPLATDEVPEMRSIRFRTLGCYPLTGAVESSAKTLPEVIQETLLTTTSERQGRAIDKDAGGAGMEKKKQEGYF